MKWIFNPPVWLLVSLALLVVGLFLWVFFPPGHSRRGIVEHPVAEVIAPIPAPSSILVPPSMPHSVPDASGSADGQTPADVVAADTTVAGDDGSVMVLETIAGSAPQPTPQVVQSMPSISSPYFLKVRKVFESEKDAVDYAEDVLSEHGVEECQIGVMGQGANQRFFLLVGPFKTRHEAIRVQSRLTAAKVRTLFIGERFLHRFQSIEPVSPPKTRPVSQRQSAHLRLTRQTTWSGRFSLLGRPVPSAYFVSSGEQAIPVNFGIFCC